MERENPCSLVAELQAYIATMEISVELSQKLKAELPGPSDITLWHMSRKEVKLQNLQGNR